MEARAQAFLNTYLASLPLAKRETCTSFSAEYFCAEKEAANTCADLVRAGIKVATCSLKYWYDQGGLPMPKVGHLMVVTDWDGNPISIIETTSVTVRRFCDVGEEHAYLEGEGDRTLAYWRRAHWDFFTADLADEEMEPSEEMELVLEGFKVVFPA
ncbi:MAG: ASCH domain-containing protein [Planctomycetota bacterium]